MEFVNYKKSIKPSLSPKIIKDVYKNAEVIQFHPQIVTFCVLTDCPSLLNLCGDTIHSSNATSTGNQVFITFVSDGYLESKGFQMRIHFIKHEDATITEEENGKKRRTTIPL